MTSTTSLKLPEELKAQIAEAAKQEGKTAHALMVDTLQTAMDETRMRKQFYLEAMEAYQETVESNICFNHEDVAQWMRAKLRGEAGKRPQPGPYDPSKPMHPEMLRQQNLGA